MNPLPAAVLALSVAMATVLPVQAHAVGPSEASVVSTVASSFVVLSVLPIMAIHGVSEVISSPFRAKVTNVTPVPGKPTERTIEAITPTGGTVYLVVPAKVVSSAGVGPGTALVGEKSEAGLIISADNKPFVLAASKGKSISKHEPL